MLLEMFNFQQKIVVIRPREYFQYDHPTKVESLSEPVLKARPLARICVHKITYNYQLSPVLYDHAEFIYFVRSPRDSLNHLVTEKKYTEVGALRYYCYRLRRLCEMARKTGGVLLTWDDLVEKRAFPLLKEKFVLKEIPYPYRKDTSPLKVSESVVEQGQRRYNRYLSFLQRLPLTGCRTDCPV